jgi:hypothetical protein
LLDQKVAKSQVGGFDFAQPPNDADIAAHKRFLFFLFGKINKKILQELALLKQTKDNKINL